ncbi:MAG: deoxynucleoside kinase [Anaerolineaceae bacterium]|jgi:deoxyguanosine kinase|nr:MAG: deoxynucleoside kinase [Anaerolineaceae bacterium]
MYIAIEGVIGVGKTSLARLLQPSYKSNLLLEIFEENPFLQEFYQDRARYAFQTQIFFLLSRYHQQRNNIPELLQAQKNLITDYTFEKDALFADVNLRGDELEMYYSVHAALAERIPVPDLTVYLKASTDILLQRITMRDRSYERSMEPDYIALLNEAYENFFNNADRNRNILIIDTNELDFVHNPADLQFIDNRIRQTLHLPPFQAALPID